MKIRLLQQRKIAHEDPEIWSDLPRELPMSLVVGTNVTGDVLSLAVSFFSIDFYCVSGHVSCNKLNTVKTVSVFKSNVCCLNMCYVFEIQSFQTVETN